MGKSRACGPELIIQEDARKNHRSCPNEQQVRFYLVVHSNRSQLPISRNFIFLEQSFCSGMTIIIFEYAIRKIYRLINMIIFLPEGSVPTSKFRHFRFE